MDHHDKPEGSEHEARSRFAASAVLLERLLHDLKQPLNYIRVVAQDLRLDAKRDRLRVEQVPEGMLEIEEAVDQLASWIDRLRLLAGQATAEPMAGHTIDLQELCAATLTRFREAHPQTNVVETFAASAPVAASHRGAIDQALWELLDNANHAAREAERSQAAIEVTLSAQGSEAVITVRDNGAGVSESLQEKLFEPFFTTREQAAGLGLALAAALTKEAGGRAELSHSDGQGCVFALILPAPTRPPE